MINCKASGCIAVFFLIITLFSCSRTDYVSILKARGLDRFYFAPGKGANSKLAIDIDTKSEGRYKKFYVPMDVEIDDLAASFDIEGYALFVGKKRQTSGETVNRHSGKINYRLYSLDGKYENYTVEVIPSDIKFESFSFQKAKNPGLENFNNSALKEVTSAK